MGKGRGIAPSAPLDPTMLLPHSLPRVFKADDHEFVARFKPCGEQVGTRAIVAFLHESNSRKAADNMIAVFLAPPVFKLTNIKKRTTSIEKTCRPDIFPELMHIIRVLIRKWAP